MDVDFMRGINQSTVGVDHIQISDRGYGEWRLALGITSSGLQKLLDNQRYIHNAVANIDGATTAARAQKAADDAQKAADDAEAAAHRAGTAEEVSAGSTPILAELKAMRAQIDARMDAMQKEMNDIRDKQSDIRDKQKNQCECVIS